jgi:squalene-associated FAD-dependent desaturase
MADTVLIIGGGLAGLAAASALGSQGFQVTLLESRGRLGGRASSFQDAATGQLVDACQHVSMGCCTNFSHFCRTAGIAHLLLPQRQLYFMTPDGRVSAFGADPWPAPLHLLRSFWRAHFLTAADKIRIAWGLTSLRQSSSDADPPFHDWLDQHGQTARTVARFWGLVLTSALNESTDRIGLRYARKVFLDGFLGDRRGFEVELPQVPLGYLYGEELLGWLERNQTRVRLSTAARSLVVDGSRVKHIELRDGNRLAADSYVLATPFDRVLDLLPAGVVEAHPSFANLTKLETSPITSVHLWYDRAITDLPHLVLVDCVGQWVFNRGQTGPGEHYVQVVVSAARSFRGLGRDEVQRQIVGELAVLFANAARATLLRTRVVTEHAATFSATPGVDRWRPQQSTPLANLFLAGDWTKTGWPATMEGAVRSGYLAAEALMRRKGHRVRFVQPDLSTCSAGPRAPWSPVRAFGC